MDSKVWRYSPALLGRDLFMALVWAILAVALMSRDAHAQTVVFAGQSGPATIGLPLAPGVHNLSLACTLADNKADKNNKKRPRQGKFVLYHGAKKPLTKAAARAVSFKKVKVRQGVTALLTLPAQTLACNMVTSGLITTPPTPQPPDTPESKPPKISQIPDQRIDQDRSTGELPFTVDNGEDVYFMSSNPVLFANYDAFAVRGSGPSRTVTLTPVPGQAGTATIAYSVVAPDGSYDAHTFDITVVAASTPPPPVDGDPFARPLVTVDKLKLLGGWKVPPIFDGFASNAFTEGGLAGRHDEAGMRFYTTSAMHTRAVYELSAGPMGAGADLNMWPQLTHRNLGDLYEPVTLYKRSREPRGYDPHAFGLYYDHRSSELYLSGLIFYAAGGFQLDRYMLAVNIDAEPITSRGPFGLPFGTAQTHGGGFTEIPRWFADQYLGGRTLGVGQGGYRSGQGAVHGPSFAAARRPLGDDPDAVSLLHFAYAGGPKELRAKRPADYSNASNVWSHDPDGDIGYWAADYMSAGMTWVDSPNGHGVVGWAEQGKGRLNYDLQINGFGEGGTAYRMYVYDPRELAEVAVGRLAPHQPRSHFEDWRSPVPGIVVGAWWDPQGQVLYLLQKFAYSQGGVEWYPVIAAYAVE